MRTFPRLPLSPLVAGPLLMILAVFFFTCLDATLKHLVKSHNPVFLAWARTAMQVLLLLALSPWLGVRNLLALKRPGLQAARGLTLVAVTLSAVIAFRFMPMTQVYAIGLSAPLVAAALAVWLLGEHPHWSQWLLTALGFLGVLVALRPDAPDAGWHLMLPVSFALWSAAYHVMTRIGSRTETTAAQLFYVAFFACLMLSTALPWVWTTMPLADWGLLAVGTVFGTMAHLLLIAAFTRAPTAVVSPMVYFQIVWAALVGFAAFGEVPQTSTLAGAAIVAISGIALLRARG